MLSTTNYPQKIGSGQWTSGAELFGLSDLAERTKKLFILPSLDLCGDKGKYFKHKVQFVLNQLSSGDLIWRSETGLLGFS